MYDYCVDDPVSFVDPDGLEFSPLPRALRKRQNPSQSAEREKKDAEEVRSAEEPENSTLQEAELSFTEAFSKGMGNMGPSTKRFVSDLYKAVTNPGETGMGILAVMDGYFCQLTGIKSHTRPASDKVTEHFAERMPPRPIRV